MSTSVVMMDTGAATAHRRTTSTGSSFGDLSKPSNHHTHNSSSNVPINFAMKFFNSSTTNSANTPTATSNHLLSNSNHNHRNHSKNLISPGATTPTSTPQVQIKLEPRVPSPCTADLAISGKTRVPSPCIKDLSFYLSKSATTLGQQLANGGVTTLSMSQHLSTDPSQDSYFTSGHKTPTILTPNSSSGHGSPSPPPLLKNHHYNTSTQSPTSQFLTSSNLPTSTLNGSGMKRHHDEAFGLTNNNNNSNSMTNSQPTTTNSSISSDSPSPPPTILNGHHNQHFHHQMPTTPNGSTAILPNGTTNMVASPTSSSYSDFGSACKEEMSPSNSVNGYTSVDSLGGDPKKKKGPAPRQQEELCLVCGDRASGYHYNALTCEGCKGFFRRSITKNAVYQCKYGNNCEIDMYMRRKCQECRLKKCLSVGMRPECVVPEYQCAIKREAKRAIKDKDKPNSTTKEGLSPNNTQLIIEEKQPLTPLMSNNNWNGSQNGDVEISRKLTTEQDDIIKKLVFYQNEFESPSEEDIKKIAPFPLGDNEEDNQKRFQHVTEMTILTVQLIVEFSKRVPYFDTLFRDDQITLLKACSSEVMMLRCSRKYDIKTDSIVYANNQPYTRQNYSSACISYVADTLFNFCRRMHMLKVDNAEYALLTAIVIFSDRPHLHEASKVEEIQEKYIETLRIYVENRRPPNKCHFAKLLGILTELRTLGNINSEMCVSLKVQNKKLPPFLAEIWDIQDS